MHDHVVYTDLENTLSIFGGWDIARRPACHVLGVPLGHNLKVTLIENKKMGITDILNLLCYQYVVKSRYLGLHSVYSSIGIILKEMMRLER